MPLINSDALMSRLCDACDAPYFGCCEQNKCLLRTIVESQPTADADGVVHARWFMDIDPDELVEYPKCSACAHYSPVKHDECPFCRAKMDGDENG